MMRPIRQRSKMSSAMLSESVSNFSMEVMYCKDLDVCLSLGVMFTGQNSWSRTLTNVFCLALYVLRTLTLVVSDLVAFVFSITKQ